MEVFTLGRIGGDTPATRNPSGTFTHNLESLLSLASARDRIRNNAAVWDSFTNVLNDWLPSWRYSPDLASQGVASDFMEAAVTVIEWLENNI
jgi:hypothetical protein